MPSETVVVDASVLLSAIVDDGHAGDTARTRLDGCVVYAPELVDLEVAAVLRRHERAGLLDRRRAGMAMDDLCEAPVRRARHWDLMWRAWELRDNVTAYDAVYVALAEALGAVLVTADAKLADAPGPRCEFELLT